MNQATAFPYVAKFCIGHDANNAPIYDEDSFTGMNLRDYFAAKAMVLGWKVFDEGYSTDECSPENIAKFAYALADAMMLAREQ